MANATSTQLQQLYVAYFGRPADPTGLNGWLAEGTSAADFAATMYLQPEFQDANANKSVESQVNQLYLNLFGRNADVDGLQYWSNEISAGNIELAQLGVYLINPDATSDADQAVLDNKTAAAIAYTEEINKDVEDILAYQPTSTGPWDGGDAIAAGKAFLSTVDADHAYSDAALEASIGTFDTAGNRAAAEAAAAAEVAAAEAAAAAEVAASEAAAAAEVAAAEAAAAAEVAAAEAAAAAAAAAAEAAALVPMEFVLTTTDAGSSTGNKGPDTWISLDNALTNYNVDGKEGTDTLTATISGNDSYSVSNIENLIFKVVTSASTIDMTDFSGEETVTVQGSTNTTLNNNEAATTYTSKLTGAATLDIDLASSSGTDDSVSLTLEGATSTGITTIAAVETINVTSTNDDDSITLTAAAATTLNLNGSGDLTVVLPVSTTLTTVSAADATGDLTVELPANDVTFTGGSGDDSITMSAASLTNADTIDGGTGANTLTLTAAANAFGTIAASTTIPVSNVQTLALTAGAANDAIDFDIFSTPTVFTQVAVTTTLDAADITLTDIQTDSVTIRNTNNASVSDVMDDFVYDLKDSTGTSDTLTLGLTNRDVNEDFVIGSITAAGIENVTINTTGGTDGDITVTTFTAAAATDITITGDADLTLSAFATTVDTLSASTATGDLSVTFAGEDVTATTGSGADTIAFGVSLDGSDTVDGGDGTDTLTVGAVNDGTVLDLDLNISNIERFTITETAASDSNITFDFNGDVISRVTVAAENTAANTLTFEDIGAGNLDLNVSAVTGASTDTIVIDRATDSSSDSVDIALTAAAIINFEGTITVNDAETITVDTTNSGAGHAYTIADLDASDATSVTFTNDDTFDTDDVLAITANSIKTGATIDFSGYIQDIGAPAANMNSAGAAEAASTTGAVANAATAMGTDGFTAVATGSYTIKLGDARTGAQTTTINLGASNTGADTIEFVNLSSDATNDLGIVVIDNFNDAAGAIVTNRSVLDFSAFAGIQQVSDLTITASVLDDAEAITIITSAGAAADDFAGSVTVLGVASTDWAAADFTFSA